LSPSQRLRQKRFIYFILLVLVDVLARRSSETRRVS